MAPPDQIEPPSAPVDGSAEPSSIGCRMLPLAYPQRLLSPSAIRAITVRRAGVAGYQRKSSLLLRAGGTPWENGFDLLSQPCSRVQTRNQTGLLPNPSTAINPDWPWSLRVSDPYYFNGGEANPTQS
ncbi:hypothetical protein HPP92_003806 [Vanilla planifolia]|uniref:Uncharacterized protein n=1 Tax=Vanilla planifolia TaxID=51239 RepID=A0A835S3X1_VANPL|nr:hypothetical protein HPP92_003806 [Vanilla planifolia]